MVGTTEVENGEIKRVVSRRANHYFSWVLICFNPFKVVHRIKIYLKIVIQKSMKNRENIILMMNYLFTNKLINYLFNLQKKKVYFLYMHF